MDQGHSVTVYTMKFGRRGERLLMEKSRVPPDLDINRPTALAMVFWPVLLLRWRLAAGLLFRSALSAFRSAPLTSAQAILCIPRVLEIADRLRREDPDIVHVFWARHVGMVLPVLKNGGCKPLRATFVGAHDLTTDDFLVDLTCGSAEVIFSHAEVNRNYAESMAPVGVPVHIIRRGIPLAQFAADGTEPRTQWLTASSLSKEKNAAAVIRAFAVARRSDPKLTLEICGDGPERGPLEQLAHELGCAEAVTFSGHVPRDELFKRMQHTAIFFLLSKAPWDRLPNVLKEALWAGCAVVSSKTQGIRELLPNDSVGFVVDADDDAAVLNAVAVLQGESAEQRADRRAAARKHVAENFSTDANMSRYVDGWRAAALKKVRLPVPVALTEGAADYGSSAGASSRETSPVARPAAVGLRRRIVG
jgi:glycosyltransferase involved in cell wall biosynthesis